MDTLMLDLRVALRALRRAPGFTLVAVLTLALGIGTNTAIFSVVNAVLLRPLAYANPQQLVALRGMSDVHGLIDLGSSAPEFGDYRRDVPALAEAAAVWPININLTGFGQPERIQAAVVSSNYTAVLGVTPVLGRTFTPADAGGRIGYVALISYDLWQRRFAGQRSVIGRSMRLDDDPITIVGVMPQGFRHPMERGASPMELWVPVDLDNPDPNFVNIRQFRMLEVIGRLKPGTTLGETQSQLDLLTAHLATQYPAAYPAALKWHATAIPLSERVVGDVRPALFVLLGGVGFVLLIACANVANLMLARATGRSREIAIRTALGSSRGRVIRQLLTESLLLSLGGGVLGLLVAVLGTRALGTLAALYLPRAREIGIDGAVLGFTACASILTGIVFGLVPAIQASRSDLQSVLKATGRGSSAGRSRMRAALVVAEVAVALVLVAGAGLLLRSFQRLVAVEPGFDPTRLLTMQVWLPWPNQPEKGRFFTPQQRLAFYDHLEQSVRQVPGVAQVAFASRLPFRGQATRPFTIEGKPLGADEPQPRAESRAVSPDYFETMRIPILRGNGLPRTGDSLSASTVVINRTMAEKYWPGENPVDRRIQLFGPQGPWFTIAGVVGDVRQIAPETPAREEMYISHRRSPGQEMSLVIRTVGDPMGASGAVLQAIHAVDAEQPVFGVMSMEQLQADASAPRRFSLLLLSLFATMALLLSAIGIYGVMAYNTTQRRQEIGIRMALGAVPKDVFGLVVGQGMKLVAAGLLIGIGGAWALSRVLQRQLYEVTARDPITYVGAAALLGLVAFAASYIPALRATRVHPTESMRSE